MLRGVEVQVVVSIVIVFLKSPQQKSRRYSKGRTDIEHLGPHTKIVWNKAQPPLSKKLHDFCTLMHMQPLDDEEGSFMLITRATEHPKVRNRRCPLAVGR